MYYTYIIIHIITYNKEKGNFQNWQYISFACKESQGENRCEIQGGDQEMVVIVG